MDRLLIILICICSSCRSSWTIEDKWLISPQGNKQFMFAVANTQIKDLEVIQNIGFNTVGSWSYRAPIPYTTVLGLSYVGTIGTDQWKIAIEDLIKNKVQPGDFNLIGYYLDNEIILGENAKIYFKTAFRLIKKYDPNHLILGIRFNHPPSDDVLIASRGYVDTHSFNIYSDHPESWDQQFERAWQLSGVRSIVSEFSCYADENSTGNKNSRGFGGHVKTQNDRCVFLENTIKHWAKNPLILGVEFFQLYDEPSNGRYDGEDCNYGILNINGQPYPAASTMKNLSNQLFRIHNQNRTF